MAPSSLNARGGGSLIVVGTGMRLAQQCTPEARDAIRSAEIVHAAATDAIALSWLESLNPNTRSMQDLYGEGRSRSETYAAMANRILEGVRLGKSVCAVFYGHPGVFVTPSHEAVRQARAEGFAATMLPGVSADACLYADLGLDPGSGIQSYEATDFIVNARKIDPSAALVLWQIAVAGDLTFSNFTPDPRRLSLLSKVLGQTYPADHEVVVYEAATLPLAAPRVAYLPLANLSRASVSQASTLYVPPCAKPVRSAERLDLVASVLADVAPD